MNFKLSIIIIILTYSLTSFAGKNGTVLSDHDYPEVVAIEAGTSMGSGILIAPRIVLTVFHNIERFSQYPRSIRVIKNGSLQAIQNPARVVKIKVMSQDARNELTLLLLDRELARPSITLFNESLMEGEENFAVGYGIDPNSSLSPTNLVKREMSLNFSRMAYILQNFSSEGSDTVLPDSILMVESAPNSNDQMACFGDSGGGLFVKRNGRSYLIGILDQIHTLPFGNDDYTDFYSICLNAQLLRSIPISPYIEWIRSSVAEILNEKID